MTKETSIWTWLPGTSPPTASVLLGAHRRLSASAGLRTLAKRLGILGAIAMLPAFAQVSSVPPSAERTAPHQHRTIKDLMDLRDGTVASSNWSGYAALGTSFNFAYASWIVPKVTCSSGDQYAAFWVGLDGYSSDTVEQTGTDSNCDGKNPSYYAWYEFLPQSRDQNHQHDD